jgi:hypothetical protein
MVKNVRFFSTGAAKNFFVLRFFLLKFFSCVLNQVSKHICELTEVVRHTHFTRKNPKVGQKKVFIGL